MTHSAGITAAGFPFLAAQSWTARESSGKRQCGIAYRGLSLPAFPLWPGFALDTAFYGAIVFTLWSAPAVIRRRVRGARGHCSACGYDLKGAPTCPECGA
jgi:hypothetical protein